MGTYDQDRYRSLIARAAFDCSFYKGTIQDQSAAQRAMAFVGAPTFSRCNGLPCLKQNAAADGATSGNIAAVVDTTQPFWCEALIDPPSTGTCHLIYQVNAGGFTFYWDASVPRIFLMTRTAALGNARYGFATVVKRPQHLVVSLDPVGLTSNGWVNGVPLGMTFTNTAPPVLCAATPVVVCGAGGLNMRSLLARVWRGAPTNEECAALYGAAHVLTGGDV